MTSYGYIESSALLPYQRLLDATLKGVGAVGVLDPGTKTVHISTAGLEADLDQVLKELGNPEPFNDGDSATISVFRGSGRHSLCYCRLGNPDPCEHLLLLVLFTTRQLDMLTATPHLFLAPLAECICQNFDKDYEINDMAEELSARYEELNLVYGTDQHVLGQRLLNTNLDQIVEDVAVYLQADMVMLVLPQIKYEFRHFTPPLTADSPAVEQMNAEANEAFGIVRGRGHSLVFNAGASEAGESQLKNFSHKLLATPVFDTTHRVSGMLACFRESAGRDYIIGDRKIMEVTARRIGKLTLVELDPLTGMLNRSGFERQLQQTLSSSYPESDAGVLALINLDRFSFINDAYGSTAGDDVLKQVADLIRTILRKNDTLTRVGGDEFGVFLQESVLERAVPVMERLRRKIANTKFAFQDKLIAVTASIGLAILTSGHSDQSDILIEAELACEASKELGGNQVQVFRSEEKAFHRRREELHYGGRIDRAIETDQFTLYAQPLLPLKGGPMHFEILLRLVERDGTVLPPAKFLGAAERYNKMQLIDRWVLTEITKFLSAQKANFSPLAYCWGVNLSGQSLADPGFLNFIIKYLSDLDLPPDWLYFEITETVAIRNFAATFDFITQLREMGFHVALDDFGSGYSSFEYLKKLPLDYLKIDGILVKNMDQDHFDQITVSSIHQLARHLGIQTVAEYVENEAILAMLRTTGIDFAQGYAIGKPVSIHKVLDVNSAGGRPLSKDLEKLMVS